MSDEIRHGVALAPKRYEWSPAKCDGCDRRRVLYHHNWTAGSLGHFTSHVYYELKCRECHPDLQSVPQRIEGVAS